MFETVVLYFSGRGIPWQNLVQITVVISFLFGVEGARVGFFSHFYCSKVKFAPYYLASFYLMLSHGSESMCRRLSIRESNSVIYIYRQLCFPENFFFLWVAKVINLLLKLSKEVFCLRIF